MNSLVSKIGVTLAALALVIAPTLAIAQQAITVSITSPSDNSSITVNQTTTFTGAGTGGNSSFYNYTWSWGDSTSDFGAASLTHKYTATGVYKVRLTITDNLGVTGYKEITVNVVSATTDSKPVISNVLVASKTQTTATITWDTKDASGADLAATSRVIYGTTSQKDPVTGKEIGTAPNYNYTNSEPASVDSSSPKVVHHTVTLTGLTAGTKYYFRVLSAR